jgi:hypothetical protein
MHSLSTDFDSTSLLEDIDLTLRFQNPLLLLLDPLSTRQILLGTKASSSATY